MTLMTYSPLVERLLYGGAIKILLPSTFIDCSTFRQVPDNQEVYLDEQPTDTSFIIEIVELGSSTIGKSLIQFYFDQLALDNDASESKMMIATGLPLSLEFRRSFPDSILEACIGQQSITKYSENPPTLQGSALSSSTFTLVLIYMAVYRIPSVSSDILLSLNVPMESATPDDIETKGFEYFQNIIQSLKIIEKGLFSG